MNPLIADFPMWSAKRGDALCIMKQYSEGAEEEKAEVDTDADQLGKKGRRHSHKRGISPIQWDRKSRESRSASAESHGSGEGSESKRSRMASSVNSNKSELLSIYNSSYLNRFVIQIKFYVTLNLQQQKYILSCSCMEKFCYEIN